MDVVLIRKDNVIVDLSENELSVLGNALYETYKYLDTESEFQTRTGFTNQEAREALETIATIKIDYEKM